jgi:hypothetical protein
MQGTDALRAGEPQRSGQDARQMLEVANDPSLELGISRCVQETTPRPDRAEEVRPAAASFIAESVVVSGPAIGRLE